MCAACARGPGRPRYFGEPVALTDRAVSKDFRHSSPPEIILSTAADVAASHVLYTNRNATLPGAPDNHVMFPQVWELDNDGGAVWLLSSADG